jgi:lysophospholipase L1-like esterase
VLRVNSPTLRRAALIVSLGAGVDVGTCACDGPAPTAPAGRAPAAASEWEGTHSATVRPEPPESPGTRGAWVLHIGDSFVQAGLQQSLGRHFHALGTIYVPDATKSTYTTTWASDAKLDDWLARRPALVLITLGANEVEMTIPALHGRAVEAISRQIARTGASCAWIAPTLWKKDTGILQVIHDHCAPCLFFDSDAVIKLARDERQSDGIHPTRRGGGRWGDAAWAWLLDHRSPAAGSWALLPYEHR